MMLKIALLACVVACTNALVCQPNTCQLVRCAAVTAENCAGNIVQNGGYCGCCDACVLTIPEGGSCMNTLLLGVPANSKCADGLYCDLNTYTCKTAVVPSKRQTDVVADGPCAVRLQEVNTQLAASNHMLLGLEKPHCDDNGDYLGMQYAGSQAYCVTLNGTSLSYMVNRWETGDNMDCQCARDLYDYQQLGIVGKSYNCLPNGNYAPVQCTGSVCYCADNMGQQVGTSTTPIWQQDALNC